MALPIVDKMASVAASTASATKTVASKLTSDPKDESKAIAKQQSSFFDKMIAADRDKQKRSDAKQVTTDVIARQDKFIEQKRLLRHIANNTDMMVDLLRDFKGESKDSGKSLLDMLKWLLPGLLAIPALLDPEKTKKYQTGTKAAIKGAPAVIKGAQAAAEAAQASKIKKVADAADAGADASKLAKGAEALGTTAKVLGKLGGAAGKVADSKIVNNGLRITSAGMAAGRAIQGDYTGATMEVASQGLNEVARKVKNPKAKLALTLASLGTDAAIMGRDYFNGKKDEEREAFAKEQGITTPEKESVITSILGWAGVENDQAKRIKEQKEALTPEQKAIMDDYDKNNSGLFGGDSSSTVGTISKIVSGVVLGILGGLGVKALINKRLGIPDVAVGEDVFDTGDPNRNGKKGKGKIPGPKPPVGKVFTPVDPKATTKAPLKVPVNKIVAESADDVAKVAGKKVLAKGAAKGAAKLIPGVGLALGAYGAVSRASEGDYIGAAGEAISGLATLIPGVGTAIGAVIQGGLMYRDYVKETGKNTGELNKISKDATATLGKSAEANKKTVDENGKSIQKSNETLVKNSNEMKKATDKTGTLLKTFTTALGMGVFGWITMGGKVFNEAFKVLSDVSGKLWDWVKNSSLGQAVSNGIDAVSGAIDTAAGQANLGKHGGTMTGSIFAGESGGNYGVYNVKQNGKYVAKKVDQNNTSLNTIMNMQDNKQMNAFGAYQIIGSTMKGAKKALGLTGNEKMTQQLQDRIYQDYLVKEKRKDMYKYLTGGNNLNAAITAAAMEWASIGVPVAMKGHHRMIQPGESYYAGDGHNKASISPAEFGEGMKQQRNRYLALRKAGLSEKEAYNKSFNKNALDNVNNIKKEDKKNTGGKEAGVVQSIVGGISDAGKAAGNWLSNTAVGKAVGGTVGAIKADPTAKKGVDATQPLSDKNVPKASSKPAPKQPTVKKEAAAAKPKEAAAAGALSNASSTASNKDGKAGMEWDLDILCNAAVSGAEKQSIKKCARYVRKALEKAQIKKFFSGGLGDAKDMPKSLVKMGWVSVGSNITSFKKGDIAVFPKTKSEFGHVCIWTGAVWVSDFVQKQLQPYNGANFPYTVYRAKKGYTNGQAVTASGGDYIGEDGVDENGNPISGGSESEEKKNAGEKLIDGMASLLEWAGDSDTMSAAVNWLDSIEKDKTEVRQMDSIDLAGFDNKLYGQLDNGHQYKYGNGGGVNEDTLFNPNLDRQKGASQDLLGTAGKLNGIQRQQDVGRNLLGEAGYVNPSMRQLGTKRDLLGEAGSFDPATRQLASKYDLLGEAGYIDPNTRQQDIGRDLLGEAGTGKDFSDIRGTGGYGDLERNTRLDDIVKELEGNSDANSAAASKKKKLKWYDKLFGDSNSWLGQLSNGLGFGKLFGFGQDIYKTSKSGEWGKYAMDKGMDILTNNGMGEIAGIGSDIYNVSQSGNSNDWGGLAARTLEKIYSHKDDHLKDANGNIIDNSTTDNSTTNNGPSFADILKSTGGILPEGTGTGTDFNVPGNVPGNVLPGMNSITRNTDGTSTYVAPDGRKVNIDAEGNVTSVVAPDGRTVNLNADGTVNSVQKAGDPMAPNTATLEPGELLTIPGTPSIVAEKNAEMAAALPAPPVEENNIIPTVKEDTDGNRTYYNGDGSTVTRDADGRLLGQTPPTTDVPNRFEDVKHRIVAPGEENQVKPMAMVKKQDLSKGTSTIVPESKVSDVSTAPLPASGEGVSRTDDILAAVTANQNQYDNAFAKLRKDKIDKGEISAHNSVGTPVTLTPNNKLENGVLQPDMEGRATLDDHVAKINRQYEQSKNNATVNGKPNTNVPDGGSTSSIAPISAGNKNGGQGNTAPIVTRNPDSIFREVSMTMMRASTT